MELKYVQRALDSNVSITPDKIRNLNTRLNNLTNYEKNELKILKSLRKRGKILKEVI